jgi:hypothetical protein
MAVAHVVGGLSLEEGRMFRSHLLECTACRARVGELRAIAHDLADVEKDERRERAAQRTETKEREGDAAELAPSPGPQLRWRTTIVIVVALGALMALSAWNFVLRSQIDVARQLLEDHRGGVDVLRDGTRWTIVQEPEENSGSTVSTLDDGQMFIVVEGLDDGIYSIYLQDRAGDPIGTARGEQVRPTAEGSIFRYFSADDDITVDEVANVLVRSDDLQRDPARAERTVFEAERPDGDALPRLDDGVDPESQTIGTSGS